MPRLGRRKVRSELKELLMLLTLKLAGPVGRYRLKKMLGLSEHEGLVRLMLADLRKGGYVSSGRRGSKLTVNGEGLLEQRLKAHDIVEFKDVNMKPLKTGRFSVGVHLLGKANAIQSCMKQRDVAVRAGATGATILTLEEGLLSIPTVYRNFSSEYPNLADRIHRLFNLADGDVLIIASAEDRWRALEGALAAAEATA